ncbi:type VI secretion system lipoprotein TssJ [Desulfobulbus sp.]|uniref:type VI secretion system lipoprotein TssJ n=1 Tax=Desulfobulbus sp. TaxID=895 RepID=UPI0027BA2BC4|nr:type VI secretion system lipoprotein TssJ [Desulfobulbus sp.]
MRTIFFIVILLLTLVASGCSWFASKPPPPPLTPLEAAKEANEKARIANEELKKNYPVPQVKWTFAAKAIEIRFKADAALNSYDDEPHTLAIAVYQMSDPSVYLSYGANRDKLSEIMEAHRFDPSVTSFDQLFLQPGEERVIRIDRAENSRFVGIVAGYFQSDPDQVTRMFEVPVLVTPGKQEVLAAPGTLNINIFAGRNMIQQYGSN